MIQYGVCLYACPTRKERVEVPESEHNGVKTSNRLSDAAHSQDGHTQTTYSSCFCVSECMCVINLNYTTGCRPCAISSFHVRSHKQQQECESKRK